MVYKLTNMVNGKGYVGKTVDSIRRMLEHRKGHKGSSGKVQYVDRAIQKHGWENFKVEWLETNVPKEQLLEREAFHMRKHDTMAPKGYNLLKPGVEVVSIQDPRIRAWWELRNPEGVKKAVATLTAKREAKLALMDEEDAATLGRRLEMGRAREKKRHRGEEMPPNVRWSEETRAKRAATWEKKRQAKAALMEPEEAARYLREREWGRNSNQKRKAFFDARRQTKEFKEYQKEYRQRNKHKALVLGA